MHLLESFSMRSIQRSSLLCLLLLGACEPVLTPDGGVLPDGAVLDGDTDAGTIEPEIVRHGRVFVTQTLGGSASSTVGAAFDDIADPGPCTRRAVGETCEIIRCSTEPSEAVRPRNAGTITVSGGSGEAVSLSLGEDGRYAPVTTSGLRWNDGDEITIDASGGQVGLFTDGVTFPTSPTVSQPAADTALVLDRSEGLSVAWDDTLDDIVVSIEQTGRNETLTVRCVYNAALETPVVVPAAALADLATTAEGTPTTVVRIGSREVHTTQAAEWEVQLEATVYSFEATAAVR
jgi:hypothetical protein